MVMITAYKYLILEDGILLVFEKELPLDDNIPIDVIKGTDNDNYLRIKGSHLAKMNTELINWLKETKRLYVASSEMFDLKIKMQGAIELDDISMGKLLAYMEMTPASEITRVAGSR
jgi:hypothetical protein